VALKQANHWQDDPCDADIAVIIERFAKRFDHGNEIEPAKKPCHESSDNDHHERVKLQRKPDHHDQYSDQRPIAHCASP
jgi:hypothetical protein